MAAHGRKPNKEEEEELIYGDPDEYGEYDEYGDVGEPPMYDEISDEEPPTNAKSIPGYGGNDASHLMPTGNIPEYGGSVAINDPSPIPEYGGSIAASELSSNIPDYDGSDAFVESIPEYGGSVDACFNEDDVHYKTPKNPINRQADSFDEEFPINPPPPRPKAAPPPPPPPSKTKPTAAKPAPPPHPAPPSSAKPGKAQQQMPASPISPPKTPLSATSAGNFDDELKKAMTKRKVSLSSQTSVADKVAERMAEKAAEGMTVARARPKEEQRETDFEAAMRRRKEMAERKQQEVRPAGNVDASKQAIQRPKFDQPKSTGPPSGPAWRAQLKPVELGLRPVVQRPQGPGVGGGQIRPQLPRKPQPFKPVGGATAFAAGRGGNIAVGMRHPTVGGFRNAGVRVGGFKPATVVGVKPVVPRRPPNVTLNATNIAAFKKKLELTEWQKQKNCKLTIYEFCINWYCL